jgi:hypothetical protein
MSKGKIMTQTQRIIAIQLAILHTFVIPLALFVFTNLHYSLFWIGTLIFLHQARINYDYSEFNRAKTYWFMLIVKVTSLIVLAYLSKDELLDLITWLIAFYG